MLLILRLFWVPTADCLLPSPSAHGTHRLLREWFDQIEMGTERASCCCRRPPLEQKALPKGRAWPTSLNSLSPRCPPTAHLLPAPCSLAPELGCLPRARKLFTKGNNSDKGLKLASNDGKHFVERSVDKRGNRAVKKIGGEGHGGTRGLTVTGGGTQNYLGQSPEARTAAWTARPKWPIFPLTQGPPSCAMAPGLKAVKEAEPASFFPEDGYLRMGIRSAAP